MTKHIIVMIYVLGLISLTTGCTSTNSSNEEGDSEVTSDENTDGGWLDRKCGGLDVRR